MRAPVSLLPLRLDDVAFQRRRPPASSRASSVTIKRGPRTIVLGPNGAGKSVLLRLCHGLLEPTAGTISWYSPEVPGGPRRQAMVFQRADAAPALGARQRDLCAEARRRPFGRARIALSRRYARSASKARRIARRVSCPAASSSASPSHGWALRPEILFLDEPTASSTGCHARNRKHHPRVACGWHEDRHGHAQPRAGAADSPTRSCFCTRAGWWSARRRISSSSVRHPPRPPITWKESCHGSCPSHFSCSVDCARQWWRAGAGSLHHRRLDDLDRAVGFVRFPVAIFEKEKGIQVRVVALGTGQALDLARRGDADVVFVHAKAAEEKFLAEGQGVKRFARDVQRFRADRAEERSRQGRRRQGYRSKR